MMIDHPLKRHKSRSTGDVASPGPGTYSPQKGKFRADMQTGSFGKSRRFEAPAALVSLDREPGPGDFKKTMAQEKLWKNHSGNNRHNAPFGRAPRKFASMQVLSPGPGDYEPNKALRTLSACTFMRSTRFGKEKEVDDKQKTPGPATYHKTAAELGKLWTLPRQPHFSVVPRRCIPGVPEPQEVPEQLRGTWQRDAVLFSGLLVDAV
eukprot:TRINITY_DN22362_c0_g1_i1.p1 TRINITY_DN22362_c0_g1~~TRINITY_DN22362_c0_g1_i1.p1  ORF type:complete len:207 (-),score=34.08 TRINITY_DN22362_c0_g1_i1:240-860(-)